MTNFVWEMLQMPFFKFSAEISANDLNLACLQASMGDALILIIMFWFTAMLLKSRKWIFHLTVYRIGLFLLPGIGITIAFEYLATGSLDRWVYSDLMPTLPFIGTGIVPLLQWFTLPLLVLWIIRRQLK
ncbi:MAG: hypothetical protein COA63_005100 [Methylophaga sp.]|nr:hypothetical protein [Methylophaga sp.]